MTSMPRPPSARRSLARATLVLAGLLLGLAALARPVLAKPTAKPTTKHYVELTEIKLAEGVICDIAMVTAAVEAKARVLTQHVDTGAQVLLGSGVRLLERLDHHLAEQARLAQLGDPLPCFLLRGEPSLVQHVLFGQ